MPEFILLYFIPLQKLFISIHIIKYCHASFCLIVRFKKEAVYILVLFEQQSQTVLLTYCGSCPQFVFFVKH